ncbi:MAG: hypothetical protein QNJ40_15905 [Xanthomonadales bacterium]|nr:hypothetical protein [Xanthomonadales bacterium]
MNRPWIWLIFLALFALSVPWYLPKSDQPPLWLGLPYWVVLSLLACLAIAIFTAWTIGRYWPGNDDTDGLP